MKPYNHHNVAVARRLRKNMTPQERKLWYLFLKDYPIRFRRQSAVGNYIVDFYCPQAKLVIELDGSQHFWEQEMPSDEERTHRLEEMGLRVLRFSNRQVNEQFDGVCYAIQYKIKEILGG